MSSHLLSPPRSSMPKLPIIEHPLSRLGDPETLSLRGFSRADMAYHREEVPETRRNIHTALSSYRDRSLPLTPLKHHIPEGVQVNIATDQNKTRLPIFGQRADIGSRAESRVSTATSRDSFVSRPGTQLRLEVDELEHTLREKLRSGGYFSLKQLFKNNDPEGKGQVNRDVLLMMLSKFLGRPIGSRPFQQLLLRLNLSEKMIIKYEELYAAVRDPVASGRPTWLDPVNRKAEEDVSMTASQVHAQLKTKQKYAELTEVISKTKPDGSTRILPPEFRDILRQLGFCMEDEEFHKLCGRYDVDGTSVIKADYLLKRLGNEIQNQTSSNPKTKAPQSREMSWAELERKASLNIEKWLKDKFREGFRSMKEEFEKRDPQRIGKVEKDDFLAVLEKFELKLKDEHFNLFLARCGLEDSLTGVSYMDLLRNFQDRSEKGITHKILSDPNHRFHREGAISPSSTLTAVEARLANLFQSDFLALLATFEKIDKFKRNVISQEEFRAAIESRFGVEITDEDLEQLLDRIPLDEDGNVRYPHFMAMFDSRQGVPSLFDQRSIGSLAFEEDREYGPGRTPEQLFKVIKSLIHKNYAAVEKEFEDLDEMNSRRLTQETMYFLLKRLDIQPGVTRGEIRRLWSTFITNQDKTLDYLEFVRHFGYSPKSACYPNAKISPPKKGDGDFKIRSKKLNCDSDILIDNVRAKVEYLWDDLRREFEDLDPYGTGFVSKEEFKDLLSELCIHLNDYEREMLSKKFESNGDGRVSYFEFLKPFVPRRQALKTKTNMEAVMRSSQSQADPSENHANDLGTLTSRMRKKLKGEWKTLRRAFKKLDMDSSGYLSLPEFRSVLKLCNFVLDEDEIFHIMSKYDQNMDGRINYKSFLEHTCKKENCSSPKTPLENTV
ncbi:EF-hand calcium-binding domain-containing protein 6-like isoform X1 [Bufo gargarizans]|uniref:EF-hand calcium-binding domain-containing protein 6-like isoform X1 n=1 Tax=Bufo gargarizans TaxID=30331 RepID=UPI001CF34D2C|nr:EF-hand calcium-binding domain-containing protein 6-like isoform X1 [Bufo gargarizans]XP_044146380.1 EF-hand calcium-binding domain-containing protein 6-like isoform X1 [Bufo gargarizans]